MIPSDLRLQLCVFMFLLDYIYILITHVSTSLAFVFRWAIIKVKFKQKTVLD